MSLAILIGTIVADLMIGVAAYKMARSAQAAQASNSQTNATVLSLLAKHTERLDNHEVRIVILERQAA